MWVIFHSDSMEAESLYNTIFLYFGGRFFSEKPISPSAALEQTYLMMLYHLFVFPPQLRSLRRGRGRCQGAGQLSWMGGAGGCWGRFRSPLQPESQCADLVSYKEGIEINVLRPVEFPLEISGTCLSKPKKIKMCHTYTLQSIKLF